MRYRILYIALSLTTLLAVSSCNSCSNDSKKRGGGDYNPVVAQLDETKDSALLVVVKDFDADSVTIMTTKGAHYYTFQYTDAQAMGQFHGKLMKNATYSVFPDTKTKRITRAINVTQLCADEWYYDKKEQRGIQFNHHGGMSSINSNDICFREWKLLNGVLYIYYVGIQQSACDRHQYSVSEAHILQLDDSYLEFLFEGKTYRCSKM
ncbi:MAG: hypothetical protein KBT34_02360 [Prevotella sp.]|nr:hypothetical protein [Candidatus Prevotella equi]